MKKIAILSAFLFGALWLSAQITVTNATFPTIGDTLKTVTDFTPSGIEHNHGGRLFFMGFQ